MSALSKREKQALSKTLEDQEIDQDSVQSKISGALLEYIKSLYLEKKFDEFFDIL